MKLDIYSLDKTGLSREEIDEISQCMAREM